MHGMQMKVQPYIIVVDTNIAEIAESFVAVDQLLYQV